MELRKITDDELKKGMELHRKWRFGELGGIRLDLSNTDLSGRNLNGASLDGASLNGASLDGASLDGASLDDASLDDASLDDASLDRASLNGASLNRASLNRASLDGASLDRASLNGAIMPDPTKPYVRPTTPEDVLAARKERMLRYRERNPDVPVIEGLDERILSAITIGGGSLEMSSWHSCGTTHCRGGWAINFGGEKAHVLEGRYGSQRAATMIYRASTGRVPHFFASNERALEDIKACAAEQAPASATP